MMGSSIKYLERECTTNVKYSECSIKADSNFFCFYRRGKNVKYELLIKNEKIKNYLDFMLMHSIFYIIQELHHFGVFLQNPSHWKKKLDQ